MTARKKAGHESTELRRQAEEIDRERVNQTPEVMEALSPEAAWQLIHELRVHKIELEMQNDELRRAQAKLDESRARYFELYDLAPVGYLVISAQGLIIEANLTFASLLGVARKSLLAQPLSRHIFFDDQDCYYLFLKHLFETAASQACELRLVKPDGRKLWVKIEANFAQDSFNEKRARVVVSDVSESKRAEEEVRRSSEIQTVLKEIAETAVQAIPLEELFARIYRSAGRILPARNFYIALLDEATGQIVRPYCVDELFSIPRQRPVGNGLTEYVMRQDQVMHLSHPELERLRESGEVSPLDAPAHEYLGAPLKDSTGKKIGVIAASSEEPFQPDDTKVLTIIAAQISLTIERRRIEKVLSESEKRFRELVRDVNVIIYIVNGQGRITFMNEYGLSLFGYDAGELIGKTEIETILPEYESTGRNLKKISEKFKASTQLHQRNTHENITKSHRRIWVDWTNRCVKNLETGEAEWICVGVDVTAAKRAEQERLRLFTRRKIRETLNEAINRHLSHAEMLGELRQTGMALDTPFVLTVLAIPAEYLPEGASDFDWMEWQHRIDPLIDFLHGLKIGIACQSPAGIVIIQSLSISRSHHLSAADSKLAAVALLKKISGYWLRKEAVVGVSHSTDAVTDVATLYEQAGAALQYGPVLCPGKAVYHWQDLGCYQFIVKDLQSEQMQQYIKDHLGPILNGKQAKKRLEDLVMLGAFVAGDSFQVIADRCGVHKNTIANRKKKLEDILGVDLDTVETKVDMAIALKMQSLLS